MAIKWFATKVGRGSSSVYAVTFTVKPKGLRLNAAISKFLREHGIAKIKIGVADDKLIIKAAEPDDVSFSIANNVNSCQISSVKIGQWAAEKGYSKLVVVGVWDEVTQQFVFDLNTIIL